MTIIIPPNTALYRGFDELARTKRVVFFAGIPGVGKSLMLQQFALMAHSSGRVVHLLQYDTARVAFETPKWFSLYPEIDGVTQPIIRLAVGQWARQAVQQWHEHNPSPKHILIGEVPLIGNRLSELTQPHPDSAEPLLSGEQTCFAIPAPTNEVRQRIETARQETITEPQHEREKKDAPTNVLRMLWHDVAKLGVELGVTTNIAPAYDAPTYITVFQHLLQYRHVQVFDIDLILSTQGSVYDLGNFATELMATPTEVETIMTHLSQTYLPEELENRVTNWHSP